MYELMYFKYEKIDKFINFKVFTKKSSECVIKTFWIDKEVEFISHEFEWLFNKHTIKK